MKELSLEDYRKIFDLFLEMGTNYRDVSREITDILTFVARFIDADFGYIGLLSRNRDLFLTSSIYCKDPNENLKKEFYSKLYGKLRISNSRESTSAWVINHRESVLTKGHLEEYCRKNEIGYLKIRNSHASLCVPLTYQCKYLYGMQELVVGVMEFEADLVDKFSIEDLHFVEQVAKFVGNMLWRNHRRQILNEIAERILKKEFAEYLLSDILQKCMDSVYSNVGYIAIYQPTCPPEFKPDSIDSGMLYILPYVGYSFDAIKEPLFDISKHTPIYDSLNGRIGTAWRAAQTRKITIWNKSTEGAAELVTPYIFFPNVISEISIPLEKDGALQGIVTLAIQERANDENEYLYHDESEDVFFLQILASMLAETLKYYQQEGITIESSEKQLKDAERESTMYLALLESKDEKVWFGEVLTVDKAMIDIMANIENTALSIGAAVLLLGETGVGKNLIATYIHDKSSRSNGPFEHVDCSRLAPNLIESELFGHEKGAFTGAHETRIGFFERAHRGTIFLDEITNLPYELQSKLLTAVEQKKIQRLGGKGPIEVDVRVIAATNQDLEQAIDKTFRKDLYYRLSPFTYTILPLRERRNDILPLAFFYSKKYSAEQNKQILGITFDAMKALKEYSWPGNVRELQGLIQKAVSLTANGSLITLDSLSDKIREMSKKRFGVSKDAAVRKWWKVGDKPLTYEEMNKRYLEEVLDEYNGNVSRTADAITSPSMK